MFGWQKAQAPPLEMVLGDMFEIDWVDADFIFGNLQCFSNPIME